MCCDAGPYEITFEAGRSPPTRVFNCTVAHCRQGWVGGGGYTSSHKQIKHHSLIVQLDIYIKTGCPTVTKTMTIAAMNPDAFFLSGWCTLLMDYFITPPARPPVHFSKISAQ